MVLDTDSIIRYEAKSYLVDLMEDYDKGKLIKISIWKSLGYLEFTENEVISSKMFRDNYGLSDTLVFKEQKKGRFLINGETYLIRGRENTRLYLEKH
ncbi:hypothetical protein ABIB40_002153 [Pedobacter sp. UYP30]|uniref:hypothetical protein n=1 Tax=Pedobacter sp. UYP30 TaxID=1756400 RepID=UPI0033966161